MRTPLSAVLLGLTFLIACAPAAAPRLPSDPEAGAAATSSGRTLVAIGRQEPSSLAATVLLTAGIGSTATRRPFNAGLALLNGEEIAVPYLAETLPALNSDSWRVTPDGTMQTTYRLR